jgi:hypothetical protein
MAATQAAARLAPYVEQLIEDKKAREELRRGADKLRDAYGRSRKRRVKATSDKKLRSQLISAAASIGEGAKSTVKGAQKPKKRRGRLLVGGVAVAAVGAGVTLALNEGLRESIFGSGSEPASAPAPDGDGSQP